MIIHSMTATFGKLEQETLELKPGLNVIHAPNEWGKSTWCAFLVAMLYGLDTRSKTTRTNIAWKERFAPWSGSPMSGRIQLNWQGREITIERSTTGRIPLGNFRAYETETGLEIPELTAANCGQTLLGVEQSVFRRAGFIRLQDLPVTEDDALRRRLNDLVTTGDESTDGAVLEQGLKDLRKRLSSGKNAAIPQAQAAYDAISRNLQELEALLAYRERLQTSLQETEAFQHQLENHLDALAYENALQGKRELEAAQAELQAARESLARVEANCRQLPAREDAAQKLEALLSLRADLTAAEEAGRQLPAPPIPREVPKPFHGMTPEEAMASVKADCRTYAGQFGKLPLLWLLIGLALLAGTGYHLFYHDLLLGCGLALGSLVFLLLFWSQKSRQSRVIAGLQAKYRASSPNLWVQMAEQYAAQGRLFRTAMAGYQSQRAAHERRMEALRQRHGALCPDTTVDQALLNQQNILRQWDDRDHAQQALLRAQRLRDALSGVVPDAPPPAEEDPLQGTQADTESALRDARREQQQLISRIAQYTARMEALGSQQQLREQLAQAKTRLENLKEMEAAVLLAQQTLADAAVQLQRRFSPQITRKAQEYMAAMTDGRYDRLMLGQDFTLHAGTVQEVTLHNALWRSDGTVDQLYLALRLAVADELTPQAPLILDDALVRFDDRRMAAALEILKELSNHKQILLFTCQERERGYLNT